MSTFKNKNSLRTIEAQIVQKLKNNEARPKFTGSYRKSVYMNYKVSCPCFLAQLVKLFPFLLRAD